LRDAFLEYFMERLKKGGVAMFGRKKVVPLQRLVEMLEASGKRRIVLCDAYVADIESTDGAIVTDYGFALRVPAGEIVIVDHHAPQKRFKRIVTATELAVRYFKKYGPADDNTLVVVNHSDTDSVLAVAIVCGILDYTDNPRRWEKMFVEAANAADFNGTMNDIADLLQACEQMEDLGYSVANLRRIMNGAKIGLSAEKIMNDRRADREKVRVAVGHGIFRTYGRVCYAFLDRDFNVDPVLWFSFLPGAAAIVFFVPHPRICADGGRVRLIARMGIGPAGVGRIAFDELDLREFDPAWKGKWNAGSDYYEGTNLDPKIYVRNLNAKIEESLYMETHCPQILVGDKKMFR